jgi:hypothetical protein
MFHGEIGTSKRVGTWKPIGNWSKEEVVADERAGPPSFAADVAWIVIRSVEALLQIVEPLQLSDRFLILIDELARDTEVALVQLHVLRDVLRTAGGEENVVDLRVETSELEGERLSFAEHLADRRFPLSGLREDLCETRPRKCVGLQIKHHVLLL